MLVLFLTVLIDLIGFGMIIPILPFAAPRFGATELDIALILVTYSVCGALASPLWGRLSDRWGRKKTLLSCLAGTSVCYVLLAFVTQLWMLYAVRIVAGCFTGNFGVASAYAADLSTPETRAKAMGMVGAAFGLGMVIGPSMGGLLAGPEASLLPPALTAATLSLVAIVLGLLRLPETVAAAPRSAVTPAEPLPALLRRTGNTSLVVQFLVITAAISTISYLFPLAAGHLLHWTPREVGIVFGVQGLCMALLQAVLVGRLVKRFGELPLLRAMLPVMLLGFGIAAFAHDATTLVIGFFIAVSGASACTPVLNTLLSNRTPFQLRGRMLGSSSAASAWGRVAGPLLAGLVLHGFGYPAAWVAGGLVGAITLAWALRVQFSPVPPPQAAPAGARPNT